MRRNIFLAIAATLIGVMPVAQAQQNAADLPKQHSPANEKEATGKENKTANVATRDEKQKEAIKNRRDHRRGVNHRLRRRV